MLTITPLVWLLITDIIFDRNTGEKYVKLYNYMNQTWDMLAILSALKAWFQKIVL